MKRYLYSEEAKGVGIGLITIVVVRLVFSLIFHTSFISTSYIIFFVTYLVVGVLKIYVSNGEDKK